MFKVIDKIEKMYENNMAFYFEGEFKFCEHISEANQNLIKKVVEKKNFTGKKGEVIEINFIESNHLINMYFVGFGKEEEFTTNTYREVLFKVLNDKKGTVLMSSDNPKLSDAEIICEIVGNVNYEFDTFKRRKKEKIEVELFSQEEIKDISEAAILSEVTSVAKELINLPANELNTKELADKAIELGEKYGFEVEIIEEEEMAKLDMNLFLAVGRASVNRPRVIVMRYFGDADSNEKIGLVGKGLMYDTGGLSLKTPDSMYTMKDDMGGAATVIGAMCAIAKNKVKRNVVAIVGACENAMGNNAYRPGDIIKSMNGKTVEVINTDAEGRLVLADLLTYSVRNEKATEIIDVATLTGAILVALGDLTTGIFSTTDESYEKLEKASEKYGERVWRLPLFDEYKDYLQSEVADLKHTGGRMGGSITAAKFLQEFTENVKWTHIDIAGTAFNNKAKWLKRGAAGIVVKPIYEYCK